MTLETQYNQFLKLNPDTTFSFNEWKQWHGNQIEQAIIKLKQKQALVDMMQDDEELGLYDEPRVEELIPYIEPFLLRNGFEKQKNNSYDNLKCIITVLDGYYQIDWNHIEYGEISTYTDSYSLMHLVGVLTWNDLIDKNYKK